MLVINTFYQVVRHSQKVGTVGQGKVRKSGGTILQMGWIGHTLRKPQDNVTRQTLKWNPHQGRRNRRRPIRSTWRTSTEQELKATGKFLSELEKLEKDRGKMRTS